MRPILLGAGSAFFFSVTFILNRAMDLSGGSWIWSASLRYFFMVPFLLVIVCSKRHLLPLLKEMRKHPWHWLLWSLVGFGLFYAPLCFAAANGPGWLIASTWQITLISGSLLCPLFSETIQTVQGAEQVRGRIPVKGLGFSLVILIGVIIIEISQANELSIRELLSTVIPMIIASFAYPLGNRKMMALCEGRLNAFQRVLGMTLASMPFWLFLALYGSFTVGPPTFEQTIQTLLVALSSGVVATVLFFRATDLARGNMQKLAAVEATQSLEILFAVIGELTLLTSSLPSLLSWTGMLLVICGMVFHSYAAQTPIKPISKGNLTV